MIKIFHFSLHVTGDKNITISVNPKRLTPTAESLRLVFKHLLLVPIHM